MLDWNEIFIRSLYYIGISSPIVFFACCGIIYLIEYFNQKQEKKRKMLKKYNKQRKSKHTRLTDINSDSSTQLCPIDVENPNEDLDRLDETHPLLKSYFRDSIKGSFINDLDKRHLKYSDSTLLLPEEDTFEDMSENETDLHEKLSCLQNKRNKSQKELISLKISESRLAYLAWKDIQSKCRPQIMCCENSIGKQCKCNRADTKSYTTQKNTIKENPLVGNRNFADTSLTIDPVEVINKKSACKYDKEIGISSLKHSSNDNKGLETNLSTQKFPQYPFEDHQEYMVNSANILPLLKTHEKCPKCTVSKEENFTSKIQETECFPHDRNNPQEISSYHKDLRAPLFQNSNIPIAKRVLEDEQFHDLRQKFCGAENIQNASKPMTDEQRFNRGITNNKEMYNEKSYTLRGGKYFEEENTKYPKIRYAAHFTEETENENQTSNVSSTCDTSDKEEAMCNYWKSLKTKKTVSQKRNKGVQVEISSVRSNDTEQMNTDEKKGFSKGKSQEAIQSKQDIPKQAQGTIVKKNAQNNMRNQSTQINRNQKLHIPIESPQIEIMEHYPKAQLYSTQMPDDKRHTENRTCRNCKSFLAYGDYSEERIDATKPRTIYSRPRLIQTEPHYPCDEHLLPNYAHIYNLIQNEDGLIQLLPHKIKNSRQKIHDVAETDVKGIQTSDVILISPNHGKEYSKQTSKDIPKKSKSQIKIDAEQAIEKSNAEQIQAKENVLKQIKRMYAHMDPNVHEMNRSVVTQVKKVLKSKEMWHPELLQSKRK